MIRLRKIVYHVQMDRLDDEGNVVDELSTQEPLSLWAHQLDQLPDQVKAVVVQAQAQFRPAEGSPADADSSTDSEAPAEPPPARG